MAAGSRNPPRRALNVDPNGRNFIPTDCGLPLPLSRLPIEISGGAGKSSPLLFNSCFSTLPFSLLLYPSAQRDRGQTTYFFYVITRKSPLSGGAWRRLAVVQCPPDPYHNEQSMELPHAGRLSPSLGPATDKIQFARRKQAAKMLVCPPELPIGRLTDKEVVGASERRSLEGGFARI